MIKLNVWLTFCHGQNVKVGELVVADPDLQGQLQGQYRYSPEYLSRSEAFPLDPIHLPLTSEIFNADRPDAGIHGVFEDSLPDNWGRRIMARRYHLERKDQRVPQLLALLGGQGMGALSFSSGDVAPEKREAVGGQHLAELQRLARKFEEDIICRDDELALLFQAGCSPGGSRPKALVRDPEHSYLTKFPSIRDQFDVVVLESATMELARRAGVGAASSQLVSWGSRKALLVERFDVNNGIGRYHKISMQTLLKGRDYYNASYRDIADVIRRISSTPGQDLIKLFKQLVFNVMIGNTEDHLKNFCMIFDGDGWKLCPAFDLIPNVGLHREHILRIGSDNVVANRKVLIQEAKNYGIKQQAMAENIIKAMFLVVSDWEKVFKEFDVSARDLEIIGKDIEGRLAKIKG